MLHKTSSLGLLDYETFLHELCPLEVRMTNGRGNNPTNATLDVVDNECALPIAIVQLNWPVAELTSFIVHLTDL